MLKGALAAFAATVTVAALATAATGPEAIAAAPKCKPNTGGSSKWTCTSDFKGKGQQAKAPRTMPLWGFRARNRL